MDYAYVVIGNGGNPISGSGAKYECVDFALMKFLDKVCDTTNVKEYDKYKLIAKHNDAIRYIVKDSRYTIFRCSKDKIIKLNFKEECYKRIDNHVKYQKV